MIRFSRALLPACLLSGILPVTLFAQVEAPAPPAGTIIVEQYSETGIFGNWTMLQPNHESFDRTDSMLTMPDMAPGKYRFSARAPSGTTARTEVFLGDDIITVSETPQISFDLLDKMTLKLVIRYSLTISGKIGVNSDPSGMPFILRGPDGMVKEGVTPMEYIREPIGNYSVTYYPKGCLQPPAKSDTLLKDSRVDFRVKLECAGFRPAENASSSKNVTVKIPGGSLAFTDVPSDSWFGPYVKTVVNREIMAGYEDDRGQSTGKFGPADPVTVAQLSKIAHTMTGLDETLATGAPKNPAARGQWFTRYMASAEKEGWLLFIDGTVDPNRPATRAEVVGTVLQVLNIPIKWATGTVFTDVKRGTPYGWAVETAASEGIVSGQKDSSGHDTGIFHPNDPINRAEISKIIITVYEKYQDVKPEEQ